MALRQKMLCTDKKGLAGLTNLLGVSIMLKKERE